MPASQPVELVLENSMGGELDRQKVRVSTTEELNAEVIAFVREMTLSIGDVIRIEGRGEL